MIYSLGRSLVYQVLPGDHCTLVLPDGTVLNLEQTADDFRLVYANNDDERSGRVALSVPTARPAATT